MKLIRLLIVLLVLSSAAGCSWFRKPSPEPEIHNLVAERVPLNLPDPHPVEMNDITFSIITTDTVKELIVNDEDVLYCITPESYQSLATNFLLLQEYIMLQKRLLYIYRTYYEPNPTE